MRGASRGFTLLEAIVALVIFAAGALSLYAWLGSNLRSIERVQASRERIAGQRAALALLAGINPSAEPTGERSLGDLTVYWRARLLEPVKPGSTQVGAASIFELGLYEVEVEAQVAGRALPTFSLRRVGWRQTGTIEL